MSNNTHKVSKAFILRINEPKSIEYAQGAAESCDKVGLAWSYFDGYSHMTGRDAWSLTGVKMRWPVLEPHEPTFLLNPLPGHKAECASAGHGAIWKRIAQGPDEAAIILEHDAIMLHPLELEVPDYKIAVLGYKVPDPEKYNHVKAGNAKEWLSINGHEGAHAYAITKKTAQFLVDEIEDVGLLGCIDNAYFLRHQRKCQLPLVLANPNVALGYIRDSTIWNEGSSTLNYDFIRSFKENYK